MPDAVPEERAAEMQERRFLSLGQWLFLLLSLFLILPLCVSNLWGFFQSRQYLTQATFRDVRDVAALEASQVLGRVQNLQDLFAAAFAARGRLAEAVQNLNNAEAQRQTRDALEAVRAGMRGVIPIEELQLVSPTGTLLASTPDHDGQRASGGAPACASSGTAKPAAAAFAYQGHEPTLLLARSIKGVRNDPLGIVCARIRFDVRQQLASVRLEHAMHAALYLLNDRGEVVYGSLEDGHHIPYGRPFRMGGRAVPALDHRWEVRYARDSGAEVLAAYAPITRLGWGVVVEVPAAVALAGLRRLEWEAGIAAAVLVLVVGVAAVWSWRTMVQPLQSLSRTAERMAAGATGETVPPGGSRETAELAGAFNRMSLALWESQHSLERRIAERTRQLQESREFAELLLNSIDRRVIVVDRNYQIVKANAAAVRTYGAPLVGTPCYQAFEGRTEPCEGCAAARTFATGRAVSEERAEQTGSGREAMEVDTYPVFGTDGGVESVIEIARIVTAEKQLQVQMMHQEKMAAFGLLAAGVAHDIGNPLAAIESQLQLARQQPHRQDETLAVVSKEIARISRMLRELIAFTRRRRDTLMLVSANQVVEDVTRLLRHDPRARTVNVVHRLAAKLPGVRTTEDRLFQVLFNLGLNALDAMPDGGALEFDTGSRSGWVVVRVRDTGHGIPAGLRPHVFEPFFTTKAAERGTGLGLFVSAAITESMGGELTLEHSDERGSVFALFLPAEAGAEGGTPV